MKSHIEPRCLGEDGCRYEEPHHHGFECDKACLGCGGQCHQLCPRHGELSK